LAQALRKNEGIGSNTMAPLGLVILGLLLQPCYSVKTNIVVKHGNETISGSVKSWLIGESRQMQTTEPPQNRSGDDEHSRHEKEMEKKIEKALGIANANETDPHLIPRNVMGVVLNGGHDIGALETSLCIGVCGLFGLLISFSCSRKLVPAVYMRQSESEDSNDATPERTSAYQLELDRISRASIMDALVKVWRTSPEQEVALAGLDGWALMEFCRLMSRTLSVIMPVVAGILLPLHYIASTDHRQRLDVLSRLDIGNIPHEDWILWVHAVLVWFVVIVCTWQILRAHDQFTDFRHRWLLQIPRPRATTVMVRNIPHLLRSDTALRDYVSEVLGNAAIQRCYVVRKLGQLPRLLQQLTETKYEAAMVYHGVQDQATFCGDADAAQDIEACKAKIEELERLVSKEQMTIEAAARRADPRYSSSSGFITFESVLEQRHALREQFTREVDDFRMSLAPEPNDVIYENLAEDDINVTWWKWVGTLLLLAVFVFWVPVVVLISGWTTLSSIRGTSEEAQIWTDQHAYLQTVVSGVLATATLKLFMAFLPTVLYYIIHKTLYQRAGAEVQLKLQQYLTAFLLIFVVLVTSLGRGLTITLLMIADHPGEIVDLLAASLPSASHFYFNYVVLGWVVLSSEVLRMANLSKFLFYKRARSFSAKVAKIYSEPEDVSSYGIGARMSMLTLMTAISFIFCSCSPLIMVFTWIYFMVAQLVYGYLLLFGEAKKADFGGACWMQALNWLFLVLCIYVMLMVGVLRHLSRHGAILGPPIFAVLSLGLLYWARHRVSRLAVDVLPLEDVRKADLETQGKEKAQEGKYMQPECDPSITKSQSWANFDSMVVRDS